MAISRATGWSDSRLEFREAANSKRKSWVAPWRCGFAGDDRNARACRAAGQVVLADELFFAAIPSF